MSPDEIEQIRSNQAVNRAAARDSWDLAILDSIDDLLEHIDQRAGQITALKELAIEECAMRICTIPSNWWNEGESVKGYFRLQARQQLEAEYEVMRQ